jgi:cell division protein FtsB
MHVDLGIWGKMTRMVVFLLFLAAVLAVVIWYRPLILKNEAFRKELLRLREQVRLEEERSRQIEVAINAIRHDPATLERLARERLSYAKPGETIFFFEGAEIQSWRQR